MKISDFKDIPLKDLKKKPLVLCFESIDMENKAVYHFIAIKYKGLRDMLFAMDRDGEGFDLARFGEIIGSGYGSPDASALAELGGKLSTNLDNYIFIKA